MGIPPEQSLETAKAVKVSTLNVYQPKTGLKKEKEKKALFSNGQQGAIKAARLYRNIWEGEPGFQLILDWSKDFPDEFMVSVTRLKS